MLDTGQLNLILQGIQSNINSCNGVFHKSSIIQDLILQDQALRFQKSHINPLNKFGNKCFSQFDEDGITLEIIRRLGIDNGTYFEIGVGNGLENNTLILAALGWKGFWIGGEQLQFNYRPSDKFFYVQQWVTLDNIKNLLNLGLSHINTDRVDVVSLDVDGNDIHFAEECLSHNIKPKLFIVEYNAKFIPPVKFQIDYNPTHNWNGDDYFGASLSSFVELFNKYGYQLVCCNYTGANAFFVDSKYMHLFNDVPTNIMDIYSPPRYFLYDRWGHRSSSTVVEKILYKT